jgi:hypothetical protein
MGSLLAPTLVLVLIAIHEMEHSIVGLTSVLPAAVGFLAQKGRVSTGGQDPSASARARAQGNDSLPRDVRRPAPTQPVRASRTAFSERFASTAVEDVA